MVGNTEKKAWLLIIRSPDKDLHEHKLMPGQNNLGRETNNDIVLHDDAASSYHAEIHYNQAKDTATIRDLESTNGTFVNGKRIHKTQALYHEDQIRVGLYLITIIHPGSPQSLHKHNVRHSKTPVTSELILESIDQYGILLHEVGLRLVNMPDLDTALAEIMELIKRMIAAGECQIIMADQLDRLTEMGVPTSIAQKTIQNKTATMFSSTRGV